MKIILASASTARTKLLSEAKIPHSIQVSGVDEESEEFARLTPADMVLALSLAKATAVAAQHRGEEALVIGADSTLEFQGMSMAKPQTAEIAISWWRNYVGKSGLLHTGQTVIDVVKNKTVSALSTTEITFYGSSFIADYTGEIVAEAGRDTEEVISTEFDVVAIEALRTSWGLFRDRRPDLYGSLLSLDGNVE